MKCPKCGKVMIKRFANICLTSYPAKYPWHWWCGCGNTEVGGIVVGKTQEQICREEWEKANDPAGL